jgi:hypothetical protein
MGRLRGLAAELIDAKVDILVTVASEVALAAKQATRTIQYRHGGGRWASKARSRRKSGPVGWQPNGAVCRWRPPEKRLQLLKEIAPTSCRLVIR